MSRIGFPILRLAVLLGIGFLAAMLLFPPSERHTYTNVEEWEIIRDERGRTIGVRVHRRAVSEGD